MYLIKKYQLKPLINTYKLLHVIEKYLRTLTPGYSTGENMHYM